MFCQEFHQKDIECSPDAYLDCLTTVEHTTFQADDGMVCVPTWTVISTCAASVSVTSAIVVAAMGNGNTPRPSGFDKLEAGA